MEGKARPGGSYPISPGSRLPSFINLDSSPEQRRGVGLRVPYSKTESYII
jgi:hypothetical protein